MIVLKSLSKAWIKKLAFAPSGTALAAAAGGSGLFLWSELLNGKKAEVLTLPFRAVEQLAFTPDGEHLFGMSSRFSNLGQFCAVKLATREVMQFPVDGRAAGFAPTPDSSQVIVCGYRFGSTMRNTCWSLRKLDAPVWEVVDDLTFMVRPFFLNDEHYLSVGLHAEKGLCLRVRSAKTGELVSEVSGVMIPTTHVTLSPDATRVASVSNTFIHVQPLSGPYSDKPVARNDNKKHFADLAYHPSGKYLAAASNDETVKFFDTTTWEIVRTFTWKIGKMRAVCFSPDGTLAAAGGEKGQVVVWDVDLC